jgi:hypothetical protein
MILFYRSDNGADVIGRDQPVFRFREALSPATANWLTTRLLAARQMMSYNARRP